MDPDVFNQAYSLTFDQINIKIHNIPGKCIS